ncbi:protein N-terminal asparagine amidohydrolase [Biomphalaria glabrata]
MPLFIEGDRVKSVNIDNFFAKFPAFKDSSMPYLQKTPKVIEPRGLLYIGQREVGGTSPKDPAISILGSEDATTCHIAILRHTGSGATSLIHFDGCCVRQGLDSMVKIVKDLTEDMSTGRLEMHLFGGFSDERKNSHKVSNDIFRALSDCLHNIYLVTACIINYNTVYKKDNKPFPVIYGVAVNVATGEIFPATFPDKGPDYDVRCARHFTGSKENLIIYDYRRNELTIGPFQYTKMSQVDMYLSLSDEQLKRFLSTSPDQEPENFVQNVRASLICIRDCPNPMKTIFHGRPRRYNKDSSTGEWKLIQD